MIKHFCECYAWTSSHPITTLHGTRQWSTEGGSFGCTPARLAVAKYMHALDTLVLVTLKVLLPRRSTTWELTGMHQPEAAWPHICAWTHQVCSAAALCSRGTAQPLERCEA